MNSYVLKHSITGCYFTYGRNVWTCSQLHATRFATRESVRQAKAMLMQSYPNLQGLVAAQLLSGRRNSVDVETMDALAEATALANEAGRKAERERWSNILLEKADHIRLANDSLSASRSACGARNACAIQLDCIADAIFENDPGAI